MKYFTEQWYQNCQVSGRSERIENQIQKTINDYWEYCRQIESCLPDCIKTIHSIQHGCRMHDCVVVSSGFLCKDFFMEFDSKGGFCSINKLTFVNAEIMTKNMELRDVFWLYDEVYIQEDRYEMHILFWAKNDELTDMAIAFDDVIIEGSWESDDVYCAGKT